MQVDAFTILLFGLFIKAMLGALFFVFWLNDRRGAVWFAWWSATFAFGSLSASLFLLRGFGAEFVSIGVGVASLIAAFACCWQGARAFDRRPPLWLPVFVAPGLWLAACLLPDFLDTTSYRVVLSSALLAPLIAMCAVEFWRGRQERVAVALAGDGAVRDAGAVLCRPDPAGQCAAVSVRCAADPARLDGGVQSDRVLSCAHADASCWWRCPRSVSNSTSA